MKGVIRGLLNFSVKIPRSLQNLSLGTSKYSAWISPGMPFPVWTESVEKIFPAMHQESWVVT